MATSGRQGRVLPGTTVLHRDLPSANMCHGVLRSTTMLHGVLPGTTPLHAVLPDTTTLHGVALLDGESRNSDRSCVKGAASTSMSVPQQTV